MSGSDPKILLTGASGFLGSYLTREIKARGLPVLCAGRHPQDELHLELEHAASIQAAVRDGTPDLIIHAAALSSIAECEADPQRAELVNTQAVTVLAAEAGRRLVFVSTDLVFSGRSAPNLAETPTEPLNVYGATKAAAEDAVRAAGGLIIRIPLLFGRSADGRRGATDMIRSATGPVHLFANEIRTPLHAADAARGILDLALAAGGAAVLHVAGREAVSRLELGRRFIAASGIEGVTLEGVESTDSRRPRNVSLASDWDCGRSLDQALAES